MIFFGCRKANFLCFQDAGEDREETAKFKNRGNGKAGRIEDVVKVKAEMRIRVGEEGFSYCLFRECSEIVLGMFS